MEVLVDVLPDLPIYIWVISIVCSPTCKLAFSEHVSWQRQTWAFPSNARTLHLKTVGSLEECR